VEAACSCRLQSHPMAVRKGREKRENDDADDQSSPSTLRAQGGERVRWEAKPFIVAPSDVKYRGKKGEEGSRTDGDPALRERKKNARKGVPDSVNT